MKIEFGTYHYSREDAIEIIIASKATEDFLLNDEDIIPNKVVMMNKDQELLVLGRSAYC